MKTMRYHICVMRETPEMCQLEVNGAKMLLLCLPTLCALVGMDGPDKDAFRDEVGAACMHVSTDICTATLNTYTSATIRNMFHSKAMVWLN